MKTIGITRDWKVFSPVLLICWMSHFIGIARALNNEHFTWKYVDILQMTIQSLLML